MKANIFSYILIILIAANYSNCVAQSGILDTTFGIKGINHFFCSDGSPSFGGSGNSILMQPDGKIIIGGTSGNSSFALLRFKANGKLDSTFGTNGAVIQRVGFLTDEGGRVALQKDGKILLAGDCYDNTGKWCFALARFDTIGNLDAAFGNNGQVLTSFNTMGYADYGYDVAIQLDGKIIEVGMAQSNTSLQGFGAVRFNTNGLVDSTFGTNGRVITPIGGTYPFALSVIIQEDSKIVLSGYSMSTNGASSFALLRYNTNGTLDNAFGSGGKVITYFGAGGGNASGTSYDDDQAYAIALQPDGKILLTGLSYLGSIKRNTIPIARYTVSGILDQSFGNGGTVATLLSRAVNIYDITVQQDGKIIVVGDGGGNDTVRNGSLLLARYNTNGEIDSTFGINGTVNTTVDTSGNEARAVTMQPDGKIVIAGFSAAQGIVVARYLSGLALGVLNFSSPQNPLLIYPNPIKGQATLQYTLTQNEHISLSLYDMLGRQVQTFFTSQTRTAGEHTETLHFTPNLAAGNYIICISNGNSTQAIKVTVTN